MSRQGVLVWAVLAALAAGGAWHWAAVSGRDKQIEAATGALQECRLESVTATVALERLKSAQVEMARESERRHRQSLERAEIERRELERLLEVEPARDAGELNEWLHVLFF